MPSMPKMPNMPSMSQAGAGIGLGSLGASLGMGGKQNKNEDKSTKPSTRQTLKQEDNKVQSFDTTGFAAPKQASTPRGTPKPKEAPEYDLILDLAGHLFKTKDASTLNWTEVNHM